MTARPYCSVPSCGNPPRGKGRMCGMHYMRVHIHGTPDNPRPTIAERFWGYVNKTETCWLWTGGQDADGYGRFYIAQQCFLAHRIGYVLDGGIIPAGYQIDHLCRTPPCVRPSHLEPVTQAVNIRRGEAPSLVLYRENRCARGHEMTEENTYWRLDGTGRQCKACRRDRNNKRRPCPDCGALFAVSYMGRHRRLHCSPRPAGWSTHRAHGMNGEG